MRLAALTFLACRGQVQTGICLFSLCSEPGDCRAALIWCLWATWVSSWVSDWFLGQSCFVLLLVVNVNNIIMVPSERSLVSHFSFTNTAVEQPQSAAFWTLITKYSVIWSYFFLVHSLNLLVFWLPSSLPEKKKNQQVPALLPLKLQCCSKETSPKHSSIPRLGPCTVPEVDYVC